METLILSNATEAKGRFDFDVSIPLLDDTIREPEEYFLLILDARQSPATDSITFTSGRDCISMDISADEDGELLHAWRNYTIVQELSDFLSSY